MRALVATLAGLVVLVIAACGPAPDGPPTPQAVPVPTSDPAAAVRAEAVDGPFRLVLELLDDTWQAGEPIEGRAWIELLPGNAAVDLRGSGGGLIAIETIALDGTWRLEAGFNLDCGTHPLARGAPVTSGLVKSGGFVEEDPNAAAYRAFFADPLFRLPVGRWEIAAVAMFAVGECGGPEVLLRAPLEVTVAP